MKLSDLFSDVVSVVKDVVNSSAVSPAAKADMHTTLDGVVSDAQTLEQTAAAGAVKLTSDAPAEAAALTGAGLTAAATLAGPAAPLVADFVEPVAEGAAQTETAKLIGVFEAHNKSLMADLYTAAGLPVPAQYQ